MVRVVLADDHTMVREGLKMLVDSQADMRVVGEAADGEAAYRVARELRPTVLVMDLSMPVSGGADATERICRDMPEVCVLALTVHEERQYLRDLLKKGARGYVLKRAAAAELVQAIRVVANGGTYIDPAMTGSLVAEYLGKDERASPMPEDLLSVREREVLLGIARGFTNKEIAAAMGISVKTVETYKGRVAEKLGLRSRVDMVRFASRLGWLAEPADTPPVS